MSDDDEDQLQKVLVQEQEWFNAFTQSAEFAALNEPQQREAGAVTEFFAQYCYSHLDITPEEWNPRAVVECCTAVLPRKVSAAPEFFEVISPVLTAFFNFLGRESLHPKGASLARAAAGVQKEIVTNAQDRSAWGPAKGFVMAASEAGVDIRDEKALHAFMIGFNMQQMARAEASNRTSGVSILERPALRPRRFAPPADRYAPCPCGSGKKYKFCCAAST